MRNVKNEKKWRLSHAVIAIGYGCLFSTLISAAEIVVNVSGIGAAAGEIGCALFRSADGFPMDSSKARQQWLPANTKGVTCRFDEVTDGSYALSVSFDLNGNKKVDTNFLGIPTEPWGVSNNVRPSLRAPTFEEAAFKVIDGKTVSIDVKVAK
jgi:uncharacterized protein (DUF2141 family)